MAQAVLLNGLSFAGLIYIYAAGLGLSFGLMRIVNLSHGSLYLLGGYFGLTLLRATTNWGLSILFAGLIIGIIAIFIERILLNLKEIRENDLSQTLVTLGLSLIVAEISLIFWGGRPLRISTPPILSGSFRILNTPFSKYRLAVLLIAIGLAISLWAFLHLTKSGIMIRAAIDDIDIARSIGIKTNFLFPIAFAMSGVLAGAAGVIGGTMTMLQPGEDTRALLFSILSVLLGGMGTFWGTIAGSLVVGLLYSLGTFFFPQFSLFVLFVPVAVLLIFRPQGLFGKRR